MDKLKLHNSHYVPPLWSLLAGRGRFLTFPASLYYTGRSSHCIHTIVTYLGRPVIANNQVKYKMRVRAHRAESQSRLVAGEKDKKSEQRQEVIPSPKNMGGITNNRFVAIHNSLLNNAAHKITRGGFNV